jgi:DNA-binding response OmpR family regulator
MEGIGMRVLVIDDDPGVRTVLEIAFDAWSVVAVADGLEALAVLEDDAFDALVVDVMLPRLDGFAVVAEVRASPRHADIPVVMLTARAAERDHVRAFEAGADAYVTKPFDPDAVLGVLGEVLACGAGERARRRSSELARARLLNQIERAFD